MHGVEAVSHNMTLRERQKICTHTGPCTPQVGKCPVCYWRSGENNSKKNEETESKQKQPVMDVTGDGSKV